MTGAGRFAPSPTGDLHLGNLRTALVAWLAARSTGRRFLIRMEDLDLDRVQPGSDRRQLADLAALGIDWDGEVLYQSTRHGRYLAAIGQLTQAGHTYQCFCTRREIREARSAPHSASDSYPGTCRDLDDDRRAELRAQGRSPAVRLRARASSGEFIDGIAGPVRGPVDDVVLRRGDGAIAYNLAAVVDDAAQGIDQVVRADDLVAVTPAQRHLAELLGLPAVHYLHVPLAVNQGGARLSKRDGAVTIADLAATGVGVDAVRGLLYGSLGLTDGTPTPVLPAAFVADFEPDLVPRDPWRPSAVG